MILEYHKFDDSDYQYSRTLEKFEQDIFNFPTAIIRMDDGHVSQYEACKLLEKLRCRAILGITVNFVGKPGYLTWKQIRELSKKHEIANHSYFHNHFDLFSEEEIFRDIDMASNTISAEIDKHPFFYLPTYNFVNDKIKSICEELGLIILDPVTIIEKNTCQNLEKVL